MKISHKNILITGVSSDLGRNLFNHIRNNKAYNILTTSRSTTEIEKCKGANRIHLSGIDLTCEKDLKTLSHSVKNFFNDYFSIVHFAGDFWRHKPLINTSFDEIKQMINSHYLSMCGVAHTLTPIMIQKGGGRIVAFSCNSVGYNYPDLSPFTSAKAAIESFLKCYSNEYSPYNISSTILALPTIKTNKVLIEKTEGDIENYIEPDELSEIVLNEILPQNRFVTGNIIRIIKHSNSFYNNGYFERNRRSDESLKILPK